MWRDPEVEQLVVDTIEEHVATIEEDDVVVEEQNNTNTWDSHRAENWLSRTSVYNKANVNINKILLST